NASSKAGTSWSNSSTVTLVISRNFGSFWLTSAYRNPLIDSLPQLIFPQYTTIGIKSIDLYIRTDNYSVEQGRYRLVGQVALGKSCQVRGSCINAPPLQGI